MLNYMTRQMESVSRKAYSCYILKFLKQIDKSITAPNKSIKIVTSCSVILSLVASHAAVHFLPEQGTKF